jgi:FAD/FMN-containing dehydrogenase
MGMSSLRSDDPVLASFAELVGADGPVSVAGGRTRWECGGAADPDARIIEAPAGVVTYAAPEMTVQVRAGTMVAELNAALAEEGQRTALPDRGGTVGGAIAVGENVVDVMGRGRLRDAVLQLRYVSAEGELVTSGGPVVKNVTGYNLPRLLTGSLGTLGLIGEVILRTNPIPAASRWLAAEGISPAAALDSLYAPGAVLWNGVTTWVLLEGHPVDIDAEMAALRSVGSFAEVDGPPDLPHHRWSIEPAEVCELRARAAGEFVASIGVGTVWATEPEPARLGDSTVTQVAARVKHNFDPTGRLNPGRQVPR